MRSLWDLEPCLGAATCGLSTLALALLWLVRARKGRGQPSHLDEQADEPLVHGSAACLYATRAIQWSLTVELVSSFCVSIVRYFAGGGNGVTAGVLHIAARHTKTDRKSVV